MHVHAHTHTHHKDLLLFAHTQTLHPPVRPPCISLLGPLVPMAMCGQRCLGGGCGQQGGTPSLLPVPPGPMCTTRAHTQLHTTQFTTLARLLIDSACLPVNLQAALFSLVPLFLPAPSLLSFVLPVGLIWRHLLFIIFYLIQITNLPVTMPVMAEEEYPVWAGEGM